MSNLKSIFSFDTLENYLIFLFKQPSMYGKKAKLSEKLRIHPTHLSQIFSGGRQFTEDQSFLLSQFLELSDLESDYLQLLGKLSRAQVNEFKVEVKKQLQEVKNKSKELSNRIATDDKISDLDHAQFYSSWLYVAFTMYCSLGKGKTLEEIVEHFRISRKEVLDKITFLMNAQLLKLEKGYYQPGIRRTHLDRVSPYLSKHHTNWRLLSLAHFDRLTSSELMYTAPFTISEKDFHILREKMVSLLQELSNTVSETNPEKMACVNLDFFFVDPR